MTTKHMTTRKVNKVAIAVAAFVAATSASLLAAEATSDPCGIWNDPSESLIWHTVTCADAAISVDWPRGAVTARLAVGDGCGWTSVTNITDTSVSSVPLGIPLPAAEADERVIALSLDFFDASGDEIAGAGRTASVGIVRGVAAGGFRCIPLGSAAGRCWSRSEKNAVFPVPGQTESLTLDGAGLSFTSSPGWAAATSMDVGKHTVAFNVAGSQYLADFVVHGGFSVIFR